MNSAEGHTVEKEAGTAKILNRFVAKAIDFIIVGAVYEIVPKLGFLAGLAYLLIADGLFEGKSIGKRLIKLQVVLNETGQRCGVKESILRNIPLAAGYILMNIPFIGFLFPLAVIIFESLLIFGSERGMRLGDEFAKTRVIEEVPAEGSSEDPGAPS